jgi:hypothetical protein
MESQDVETLEENKEKNEKQDLKNFEGTRHRLLLPPKQLVSCSFTVLLRATTNLVFSLRLWTMICKCTCCEPLTIQIFKRQFWEFQANEAKLSHKMQIKLQVYMLQRQYNCPIHVLYVRMSN